MVSEQFSGTMATKKVEALEEKLETEIGAVKTAVEEQAASINERFNRFQEQFSSLESMLSRLMEEKSQPPSASKADATAVAAGLLYY